MKTDDALKWLENLKNDIGKSEHSSIWHYEQAIVEIGQLLKSQQAEIDRLKKIVDKYSQANVFLAVHGWKWKDGEQE